MRPYTRCLCDTPCIHVLLHCARVLTRPAMSVCARGAQFIAQSLFPLHKLCEGRILFGLRLGSCTPCGALTLALCGGGRAVAVCGPLVIFFRTALLLGCCAALPRRQTCRGYVLLAMDAANSLACFRSSTSSAATLLPRGTVPASMHSSARHAGASCVRAR